jgi:hypothetical protein
VLEVVIQIGATQEERQAAIDLINGEVIGGLPGVAGDEGIYYVRVEREEIGKILCAAEKTLNSLFTTRRLPCQPLRLGTLLHGLL